MIPAMKKKLTAFLALLLVSASLPAFCACEKKEGAQLSASDAAENNDRVVYSSAFDLGPVETIIDKSGEPYVNPCYHMSDRTVPFLSHWNADTPDSVHMLAYTQKYGGPNVDFLTYSYGDCGTKLQTMVLSDNAPDVYKLRDRDIITLMRSDVWSDITDKFDWNSRNWRDRLYEVRHAGRQGPRRARNKLQLFYLV